MDDATRARFDEMTLILLLVTLSRLTPRSSGGEFVCTLDFLETRRHTMTSRVVAHASAKSGPPPKTDRCSIVTSSPAMLKSTSARGGGAEGRGTEGGDGYGKGDRGDVGDDGGGGTVGGGGGDGGTNGGDGGDGGDGGEDG